ncbi:ABC transporter ATP-binding protein [Synergistes jonesii]|uniref:ABC transporter ATP-binding protein n=1 Tax=Synergistes jonesii TaxID=2754 RepID=UPI00242FBC6A|nr:ABC transporter ATP-binding protein [Synergistes jonesii]
MIIEVKHLSVTYNARSKSAANAVKDISFALRENSFCGLIGESGSGKSSVVMTMLGLLPNGGEARGSILYRGREILGAPEKEMLALRQRRLSLIPQGAMNSFTPVMTIGRQMREVIMLHMGATAAEAERKSAELLEEAELAASSAARYPHELSGGQKQRAAIAMALSCSPEVLLADEPTTALDVVTQAAIIRLLEQLRREKNLTVLLVTHDLPMAASACEELLVMKDGEIVERGEPKRLISSPENEHTKVLVAAMLRNERP